MKKIILALLIFFTAAPLYAAINLYDNEDTSVSLYGTLRSYAGYGYSNGSENKANSNFIYGLQGNSRIGTKIKVGNFSAQVELGANEKTMYSSSAGSTIGLRQIWGAYSFGKAGQLLAGKTKTPSSMTGFSQDIMNTDSRLSGFGGSSSNNRRFQVQYKIKGITFGIIEDDTTSAIDGLQGTDKQKYIPRFAVSYTYKTDKMYAKAAATYTAVNAGLSSPVSDTRWATVHAYGIAAAVMPKFMDGRLYFALQARYGVNEHLYGESKTVYNNAEFLHTNIASAKVVVDNNGKVNNVTRISAAAEIGYKAADMFTVIFGGGYQFTKVDASDDVNSYAVYGQFPLDFSKNFALIPQIGWYSSSWGANSQEALIAIMQARFTF